MRLSGIPLEAYEYMVNGKPAIEWVMDRYAVTTDKDSQIRNDPNAWSENPQYIMDLLKRIVTVSVETVRIVHGLPPDWMETCAHSCVTCVRQGRLARRWIG